MWTFIALNLHQMTDSKAKLNINKMNNSDIARSEKNCRGDEKTMVDRLLQMGKF